MSLCHNLIFSNPYIIATQCGRPLIFQTMNSVISNSLEYKRFNTSSGCLDIGIRKYEIVAKTQFLSQEFKPELWYKSSMLYLDSKEIEFLPQT